MIKKIKSFLGNTKKSLKKKLEQNFLLTLGCLILIISGAGDLKSGRSTRFYQFHNVNTGRIVGKGMKTGGYPVAEIHNQAKLISAIGSSKIAIGLILLSGVKKEEIR